MDKNIEEGVQEGTKSYLGKEEAGEDGALSRVTRMETKEEGQD